MQLIRFVDNHFMSERNEIMYVIWYLVLIPSLLFTFFDCPSLTVLCLMVADFRFVMASSDKKHRVAPKPPTEEQSGSQVSIPSVQVEAELENNHISGQDRVSEGSNSTNYELLPEPVLPVEAKLNEDFPEPPDYAPPPPPPDEEEFTW
jgi:hypothetical protein